MEVEVAMSHQFLEGALGFPIERFEIRPGSEAGSGYMCVIFSVAIWRKSNTHVNDNDREPVNYVVKCYPGNTSRQEFLDETRVFEQELGVYQDVIPEFAKFQQELNLPQEVELPFTKCYYGRYMDPEARKQLGRPFQPLDNCLILPDLRTPDNGSFRTWNRLASFDLDHYSLIIEAQAKMHAVSWAYKNFRRVQTMAELYPYFTFSESQIGTYRKWTKALEDATDQAKEMFKDDVRIVKALESLKGKYGSVLGLYSGMELGQTELGHTKDNVVKVPGPGPAEPEEPWIVLIHGDAWSSNMLFRYDEETNKPTQVIFIDLQTAKEGDLFMDVVHTMYACTAKEFRDKHLESMLHLYYDTFVSVCTKLSSPTPTGFSYQEFKRRFRRSKMLVAVTASLELSVILKNPEENTDLEQIQSQGEIFDTFLGSKSANYLFQSRLKEIVEDFIEDEII